jgi:hypothetical protein
MLASRLASMPIDDVLDVLPAPELRYLLADQYQLVTNGTLRRSPDARGELLRGHGEAR